MLLYVGIRAYYGGFAIRRNGSGANEGRYIICPGTIAAQNFKGRESSQIWQVASLLLWLEGFGHGGGFISKFFFF